MRCEARMAVSALLAVCGAAAAAPAPAPAQAQAQAQAQASAAQATAQLIWMVGDSLVSAVGARADTSATVTPLGSTWKLFVYSYLVAQGIDAPPYRCQAAERRDDETYCCDPGEAVGRDDALARSCGPFFEPSRLQINAADRRRFWQRHEAPAWLLP